MGWRDKNIYHKDHRRPLTKREQEGIAKAKACGSCHGLNPAMRRCKVCRGSGMR